MGSGEEEGYVWGEHMCGVGYNVRCAGENIGGMGTVGQLPEYWSSCCHPHCLLNSISCPLPLLPPLPPFSPPSASLPAAARCLMTMASSPRICTA